MEKLIVVSGDSHATPLPEAWGDYLEAKYHDHLPEMLRGQRAVRRVARVVRQLPAGATRGDGHRRGVGVGRLRRRLGWRSAAGRDGPRGGGRRDGVCR